MVNDDAPIYPGTAPGYRRPETAVWQGKPNQIINWRIFGLTAVVIGLSGYLLPWPWSALSLLMFLPLLWQYAVAATTRYELSTQRLTVTRGPLWKRTSEIELYRIEDTGADANPLYRIAGVGTVHLFTSDRSDPTLAIEAIPDYEHHRDTIRDLVERARRAKGVRIIE